MATLQTPENLKSELTTQGTLAVDLSCSQTLTGTLKAVQGERIPIEGILTLQGSLVGSLTRRQSLNGVLSIPQTADAAIYDGEYQVTPKAYNSQVLQTQNKLMTDNVTVFEVPYYETSNLYGDTVYIASEV